MTDINGDSLTQIEQLMLCVENDLSEPCLDTLWDEVKALSADRDEWKEVAGSLKASTEAQAARIQELEQLLIKHYDGMNFSYLKGYADRAMQGGVSTSEPPKDRPFYGQCLIGQRHDDHPAYYVCKWSEEDAAFVAWVDYHWIIVQPEKWFTTPQAAAITEAVKAEREACAQVCDKEAEFWEDSSEACMGHLTKSEYSSKAYAIRAVAAAIRARNTP